MNALIRAAEEDTAVRELIARFYLQTDVEGVALRAHGRFISLFRGRFGPPESVNAALERSKEIPPEWEEECSAAGYPLLSPIYIAIYVNVDETLFRERNDVPTTVLSTLAPVNYAVFVEKISPFEGLSYRSRCRPLQGGTSASGYDPAKPKHSGTLGGFLEARSNGDVFILSCRHVLLARTVNVAQQSPGDGGAWPKDAVGRTHFAIDLLSTFPPGSAQPFNTVDAALAKVDPVSLPVSKGVRSLLNPLDNLVFVGKESDYQEARVRSLVARIKARIDGTLYDFGNVFEIEPRVTLYIGKLAKSGDSGSWVVRDDGKRHDQLCGLLFAGNGKTALCCFSETVIDALEKDSGLKFTPHC
jgi:hypothetical protein